ncbi:TonB-dependent receptor [Chromatiaceae bacterium AAb-1]|nr:TonB-dependent receptor [Chromatiaceae bacterium AAb-1]
MSQLYRSIPDSIILSLLLCFLLLPRQATAQEAVTEQYYQFSTEDLFSSGQQLSEQSGLPVIISPQLRNINKSVQIQGSYTLNSLLSELQQHYQVQIRHYSGGLIIQPLPAPEPGKTSTQATSSPVIPELFNEQITVRGSYSKSLQSAASVKRFSDSVVDAIIAEDIGKFPAQNIAEALQRVTGVSIVRDRGEGVYVRVRGLGSNFQVTTLNGNTMAVNENVRTSGQFGRQFRFDTLPAELVSAVEVVKSPTADLDEGAIGGTVNIKTFRPLQLGENKISASAQASYAELAEETNPRLSGLANWVNDSKTFGVLVSAAYAERSVRQDRALNFGWAKAETDTIITPASIRPTLELEDRKRLGLSAAMQWKPITNLDLHADMLYIDQKVNYDEFTYSADYVIAALQPGSMQFRNNALIGGSTLDGAVQIGRESSGIRDENLAFSLGATWALNDWTLTASLFHATADSHDEDPIIRTRFRQTGGIAFDFLFPTVDGKSVPDITYHHADLLDPSQWPGRQLEWRTIAARDTEQALKLDLSRHFNHSAFSRLSIGLKLRERERDYFRRDLTLTDGIEGEIFDDSYFTAFPVSDFLGKASGSLPQVWLVPDKSQFWSNFPAAADLAAPLSSSDLRNSYNIQESIRAAYAMLYLDTELASLPLKGNIGVRLAQTAQTSSGHAAADEVTTPVTFNSDYTDVLPSLNLALNLTDTVVTRFAAAKVVTRPDLQDMAPRLTFNSGDILTAVGGNPHLKPFAAWQYDLTLDWFPDDTTVFSAGAFHKDITTFIQTRKSSILFNGQLYQLTAKTNGSHARVSGAELAYQTLFRTASGLFGLQANYTRTTSGATYSDGEQQVYGRLEDVAKNSYNLTLFYENKALALRLNYSWRDDVLNQVGINSEVTENRAAFGSLDASLSYAVNDYITVFAEGINLTDQAEQEFVEGNEFRSYTYYGRTFGLGIRVTF